MKKIIQSTLYALLLFCLQTNIMIAPSFFTKIPEPTEEQPTRNTAEEARKQRAQEAEQQKKQDALKQKTLTRDQETQPAKTESDETTPKPEVKINIKSPSLSDKIASGWNTFKRRFFSLVHEKSYVKEVITQALQGDLNAMAETGRFQIDFSWNGKRAIKNLSFKDKQEVVETLQDEANKVYKQKMADLEHQKLLASGKDVEKQGIEQLIALKKDAFKDIVKKLVKALEPMLHKDLHKATSLLKKPDETINVNFDKETNAVRLELYRKHTTLDSALYKIIPASEKETQTPEQNALAKRFNIGRQDYDNTLNDNINQKYQSLTPQQQKVFIDNLNRLATSKLSTRDILDAAYSDAQKVSTSWFDRAASSDRSTSTPSRFIPEIDANLDAPKALRYIRDVEKRFTQGRIDSVDATTQISSAVGYLTRSDLETPLLPKILGKISDKENQRFQETMSNLKIKGLTAKSNTELQLIMLQKQEAIMAFKTRCQEIQEAFTEIYRKSINNITPNPQQITLTFDEKDGAAQFTIKPFIDLPPIRREIPKNFPNSLKSLLDNTVTEQTLKILMNTYNDLPTDSQKSFLEMLDYNAQSKPPHHLTEALIETTKRIATMSKELQDTVNPKFKYLLMTNNDVFDAFMKTYTQLTTANSKKSFIDMLNDNAQSTHPHPLTKTLIETTRRIANIIPEELRNTFNPEFKHLLMANSDILSHLYLKYSNTHPEKPN